MTINEGECNIAADSAGTPHPLITGRRALKQLQVNAQYRKRGAHLVETVPELQGVAGQRSERRFEGLIDLWRAGKGTVDDDYE